jgi:phage baseplate assembly protein W
MAVTKATSIEDGNQLTPAIISTRARNYSDLDLTFTARTTGDVFKKTDAAAVKQSVKTILQTNYGERPFQPLFGGNLRARLFENFTDEENAFFIEEAIKEVIAFYEPRARVISAVVNDASVDRNYLGVRVEFQIVNTEEVVVLETNISRIR